MERKDVLEELCEQMTDLILAEEAVNGFGIGLRDWDSDEIAFSIYLRREITEEEKAEILKKITDRFFSFKVVGEIVAL